MKKDAVKKIIACIVFCALTVSLVMYVNEIVLNKANNRYYILQEIVNEEKANYDVQVFGSCHAYTSFDPMYLEDHYKISSFVFANPGEIIPSTYLRMMERFKIDTPDVAVVDIWGLNAYETYSSMDRIFNFYMPVNIELIPFSLEKIRVIQDYDALDILLDNFAIAKYKDRIMGMELTQADFDYSFSEILLHSEGYVDNEMTLRKNNRGYAAYNSKDYTKDLVDYDDRQAKVSSDDMLEYEEDIVKYLDKIISLCDEYDVELIFYRAPYISTENELRKANWLAEYCDSQGIVYVDLEKEIVFDHSTDFMDYYHLNVTGAKKATEFLAPYVLEAMK